MVRSDVSFDPALFGVACRLPIHVDLAALTADVASLPDDGWVPHFNTGVYEGEWSGVAFRSPGGNPERLYPDLTGRLPFDDTPRLAECPGVAAVMGTFACTLAAVRFLRLAPGARILPHRDYDLGFRTGEVRLHIPILTSPDVAFVVAGAALAMKPGEVWYADFDRVHHVYNASRTARVHLVLDCAVDDWMRSQFESATDIVHVPTSAS